MIWIKSGKDIGLLIIIKSTLFFFSIFTILSCQSSDQKSTDLSGAELAAIHCAACHLTPDPLRITKEIWANSVLPHMSWRLGIPDSLVQPPMGYSTTERFSIANAAIFPTSPQINNENWTQFAH